MSLCVSQVELPGSSYLTGLTTRKHDILVTGNPFGLTQIIFDPRGKK